MVEFSTDPPHDFTMNEINHTECALYSALAFYCLWELSSRVTHEVSIPRLMDFIAGIDRLFIQHGTKRKGQISMQHGWLHEEDGGAVDALEGWIWVFSNASWNLRNFTIAGFAMNHCHGIICS